MYSHLTDYQRTSGPAKANGFITLWQSDMYSQLTDYQ